MHIFRQRCREARRPHPLWKLSNGEGQPEKSASRTAMTPAMSACQPWEHARQDGYLSGSTVYFFIETLQLSGKKNHNLGLISFYLGTHFYF